MPIKFLLLKGGVLGFFRRGGWKCQLYFDGRGDFSEESEVSKRGWRKEGVWRKDIRPTP